LAVRRNFRLGVLVGILGHLGSGESGMRMAHKALHESSRSRISSATSKLVKTFTVSG
jgi:hypothetical protein